MGTFGIIALILSALGMISSGVANYVNTKKTNETNQQMYDDWKEYNTPVSQMSRLTDAGLNPYMVSNVNNTLSQPFQIGQNSGISEALSGAAQSLLNGGQMSENSRIQGVNQDIKRLGLGVQRDKLELEKQFTELRKQNMQTAINKGDAQAALFWSSVDQKDVVTNYLRQTMPFRVGSAKYDYFLKKQDWEFNNSMNPFKLKFYAPYMRSLINNANARTNHLSWQEQFAQQQFLLQQDMFNFQKESWIKNFIWRKYNTDITNQDAREWFNRRLSLSDSYYDLAFNKWIFGLGLDVAGLGFGKGKSLLKSKTHKVAGGFPETDYYEYW